MNSSGNARRRPPNPLGDHDERGRVRYDGLGLLRRYVTPAQYQRILKDFDDPAVALLWSMKCPEVVSAIRSIPAVDSAFRHGGMPPLRSDSVAHLHYRNEKEDLFVLERVAGERFFVVCFERRGTNWRSEIRALADILEQGMELDMGFLPGEVRLPSEEASESP